MHSSASEKGNKVSVFSSSGLRSFLGLLGGRGGAFLLVVLLELSLLLTVSYAQENPKEAGGVINDSSDSPPWRHGTSLLGALHYPEGFPFFDYVFPDAPKGGQVRLSHLGGFDSFNNLLPLGNHAPGLNLLYDTLLTPAQDEQGLSASYGLIAEALRYPEDISWVEFRLNPAAHWHDGRTISAEDVIWSFEQSVALNPSLRFYYRNVVRVQKQAERTVRFILDRPHNRELPHILGELTILPRHWWEGRTADGKPRSLKQARMEPPLGSGPYRLARFDPGRQVVYQRVDTYWAKEHPTRRGMYNFDTIRFDSYRDSAVLFEAFKGDQYDFRVEDSAKNWAQGYNFPAVREGRVIRETFPDQSRGVMQAFIPNLRRSLFKDPRIRRALNNAFDFETLNAVVFFGQYKRIASYFAGTELAATGLPEGEELKILETVRDSIPPEVFTSPYTNPVNGTPQALRENLRKALRLFQDAGWVLKGGKLVQTETGTPFVFELLYRDPLFERVILSYQRHLKKIGVTVVPRLVDSAQYVRRLQERDFDMTILGWTQSLSPGNEQRNYWGSAAAEISYSQNYAGIADPAIDRLIDRVIFAKDRKELVAATRALDRVLLWNHFVIPQWYLGGTRTARWNRLSAPKRLPPSGDGFPELWWWDAEKAARTQALR